MLPRREMMPFRARGHALSGFSLVEVVLALSIAVFAGFTLIALFAVGLQDGSDSRERFQAASIAESIVSARRAAPLSESLLDSAGGLISNTPPPSTIQSGNPLPLKPLAPVNNPSFNNNVDNELGTPIYLTWDGAVTTANDPNNPPRFCLIYNTIFNPIPAGQTITGNAVLYLCIYWPPTSNPAKLGSRSGHFELTTTFTLPSS
jgi:type II secretory pathway pseudopilin PulG